MTYETVWTFNTARFTVSLAVADEDMDPADQFDEPDDGLRGFTIAKGE